MIPVQKGAKINIHAMRAGPVLDWLATLAAQGTTFAVVKAVDDLDWLIQVEAGYPAVTTIGRLTSQYEGCQGVGEAGANLEQMATDLIGVIQAKLNANPALKTAVDFWEVCNEPDPPGAIGYSRLSELMKLCMKKAEAIGIKLGIFALNNGTPEWDEIVAMVATGVFEVAREGGHIMTVHEGVFGDDPIDKWWGGSIPDAPNVPGAGALCFRYRYLYSLLEGLDEVVPLVVTEFYAGGSYHGGSSVLSRIKWYDTKASTDWYHLGVCPFTVSPTSGWEGQNYEPAYPALMSYMIEVKDRQNALPTNVPPIVPPPAPPPAPPPGDNLDTYLWNEARVYASQHGVQYTAALGLWRELEARGYKVEHREQTRQHDGRTYAFQRGVNTAGVHLLGIWTSGQPLRFINEPGSEPLPAPTPLPHIERPIGVDVSHWNSPINWPKCKTAGAWFAFIKATERTDWTDPAFSTNWQNSKAAGLLRGAYHFFKYGPDPIAQANWFYQEVMATGDLGELPPVLDVEVEGGPADFGERVKKCLQEIARLFGRKPLLYMSKYYGNTYLRGVGPADADLWIASWTARPNPYMPTGWPAWKVWQYTSDGDGRKYGMQSQRLDLNRFNGALAELYAYAEGEQLPTPPPVTPPTPGKIDLLGYLRGDGRQYELQYTWDGGGTHPIQTQVNGNIFYIVKGHSGEYEELYYDDKFVYRGIDSSEAPDKYYTQNTGNVYGAMWANRHMAIGETVTKSPLVIHYWKDGCRERLRGQPNDKLTLVAHHDKFTFDSGITLDDVIYLEWNRGEGYYFAKNYGLVGFTFSGGKSYISEIHQGRPDLQRQEIPCFRPGSRYYVP